MHYTTFNREQNDTTLEPMFFGNPVNVARYDKQKYSMFEKLIEKQISFFWRPEEVDVSRDRKDFLSLSDAERHIFMSNLKYQTLLDSVQGRSPNIALLPIVSIPELETWVETWSFYETIHSRSYTHILRNVLNDPSAEFDDIAEHPEISERALDVTKYYDELIELNSAYMLGGFGQHTFNGKTLDVSKENMMEKLFLAMISVNVLEKLRFYVSFACTFAFAERSLMEGNAKLIRLIARDEHLHGQGTQFMLNKMMSGAEGEMMQRVAERCKDKALAIFDEAVKQEKVWADYLFQHGSMLGLNSTILGQFVDFMADQSLAGLGYEKRYGSTTTPLPWMGNYLNSDNVQVAPQESEISSYLVGQIDSEVSEDDFADMEL